MNARSILWPEACFVFSDRERPAIKISPVVKLIFVVLFTLALIIWAQQALSWSNILKHWETVSLSLVLGCLGMTVISHLLRGLRLFHGYKLLPDSAGLAAGPVFGVSLVHNAANFVLPMRLGELVLPALSRLRLNVNMTESVKTLLGIRLFDLHVLVGLILLLQLQRWGWWAVGGLAVLFAGLLVLPLFERIGPIRKFAPPQYRHYGAIAISYVLTALIWCVKLIAFYWIFNHFMPMAFNEAAVGILTADLSSSLPINGLASAGSYEAAFAAGLAATSNFSDASLAPIINLHLFLLASNIMAAAVGGLILMFSKKPESRDG
ncbi:Uncharacterised protein [BD1-7 clade bacterium]|uniref:Flippase-like domain-containing protein n=1 Tax=BD1-7 clade bacterium TaxID=2029982 RepID=A0A5S9MY22_9GAMM|nr:Uncharacterised protein [BD1-7 clade bacterium]CAA0082474.1 Uncharacterised protein [BD1-7 clade bacterium]